MLFTMPERDATLPLWNSEDVQANIAAYANRYQSKFDNVEDWISHEAEAMDDIMDILNTIAGVPVEVWDMFHARWQEAALLYLHIVHPPNYIADDELADYFAERLDQFFEEDEMWLQKRLSNN